MTRSIKPRIVVAGAGVAGSLIVSGLAGRDDVDVICLERSAASAQLDAGTGLNIGPNAVKALRQSMPDHAQRLLDNSLPWEHWSIGLTDGTPLVDIALRDLADNPGIRIRWAELYALLRDPIHPFIRYGSELVDTGRDEMGLFADVKSLDGQTARIDGITLLIAADGRYSVVRERFFGVEAPNFLGVCLYRVLFPVGPDCPIGDYAQWFNGPNRLLAFRVPGNFVYCAGSFPIGADGQVPAEMKTGPALRAAYTPSNGRLSKEAAYLVGAVEAHVHQIHWARLQDGTVRYAGSPGVLLVGDAAHPMVPTLGQGATQSVEDACAVVDELRHCLDRGGDLEAVPQRVESKRQQRVEFVVNFSREATDTMLAGADPVAGSLHKNTPAFRAKLARLYRDVSEHAA